MLAFLNLSLLEYQFRYLALFLLFSVIDNFRWFSVGSLHKNFQLMLEFFKASFLLLYFSYYTLMTFLMMLSIMSADDTTLYIKCDQASDLWQQLELASKLQSDLQGTVDWCRKWLFDFSAGKTRLVSTDQSNNTGDIDVKFGWVCSLGKIIF